MWGDLVAWLQSPGGARVLQTAVVPAVAILVAGLLAAWIGRGAVRTATGRADREQAATAIAGLIEAARAATEPDRPRGGRRRAARLRTEADIRMRLLPLRGADRAADWAAAQTDALVEAGSVDLTSLRDTLLAWLQAPRRAPRIFAAVPGAPVRLATPQERDAAPRDPVAAAFVPAATPSPLDPDLPAWRRTKAGERLEQERAERVASRQDPDDDPMLQDAAEQTARVRFRRPSVIEDAPGPEPAPEPHARHSIDADDEPVVVATSAPAPADPAPATTGPASSRVPAWIDTYDDEAEVTQNLDLRTPPPIAASALRDRTPANSDIVPRS